MTVIFADVSGFTALSETLDPEEVVSFMNECLKELADAVYQYEGMVDSIINGDCAMAVFGAPHRNGRRHRTRLACRLISCANGWSRLIAVGRIT